MALDFKRLESLVTQNLFLSPEVKAKILSDWDTFEVGHQEQIYHRLEVAYQSQTKAFEAALEKNPEFLVEMQRGQRDEQRAKLKSLEDKIFEESERDSENILAELNQIQS